MINIPIASRPLWGQGPGVRAMPNYLPFPRNPTGQFPTLTNGTVGMDGGGWKGRRMKVCPHCKGCGLVEDDEGINVNPNEEGPETSSMQDEEDEVDSAGEEQGDDEGDTSMQEDLEQEGEEREGRSEDVHRVQPFAQTLVPSVQGGAGVPSIALCGRGVFPPLVQPPLPKQPGLRLLAPRPPGVNTVEQDRIDFPVENGIKNKGVSLMCDVCQFESTSQSVMDRHVATHTMKAKNFKCTHTRCHQRFASEESLEKHIQRHESFACTSEGCGYIASTRREFIIHERKHTGEKPFTCEHPGCGGRFVSHQSMRTHARAMHSNLPMEQAKPFACTKEGCLFRARQKRTLEDHMRSHTGEKPFSCPFPGCSASFGTKTQQRTHTQRHLGNKKFPCSFEGCSYRAMDKATRDEHLRTHTGEKPFECNECGARFRHSTNFRVHVKAHGKGG